MTRRIGALGLMLALAACHDLHAVPSTPIDDPVSIAATGDYVHAGSGIAFPVKSAGFERSDVSRYDREGNDVGVHYRKIRFDGAAVFRSEVTLFVYPAERAADGAPVPFDRQFEDEVAPILKKHDEVRELRRVDGDATHAGGPVHVRAAEFAFRGGDKLGRQPMLTVLAAFRREPWHVTYRADFPPARRDVCLADVEELVAAPGLSPTGLPATAR